MIDEPHTITFAFADPHALGYLVARPLSGALLGLTSNHDGDLVWSGNGQRTLQEQAADWLRLLSAIQEEITKGVQHDDTDASTA